MLCLNLLLQGVASIAAAPVCTHHDDPQQAAVAAGMPAAHHLLHGAMAHAMGDANTAPAIQPHAQQHTTCDCDQDCAGSCALHTPGQLLPDDLVMLGAPHHAAYPLHADKRPHPTVVAPRLRPPTLS